MAIPGGIVGWIVAQSMFNGIDPVMLAVCACIGLLCLLGVIFIPDRPPQAPIFNSERVRVMAVKDLPEEVRRHANWPYERTEAAELRPVIIIPNVADLVIEHKKYSNLLTFQIDRIYLQMDYLMGQGADIRDFLAANGWSLIWAGKQVAASPAASESDAGILVNT